MTTPIAAPSLQTALANVAIYRVSSGVDLYPRESQLTAITLADELARIREERGIDRLLTAVGVAGDFSEYIAQLQAVVHRVGAVRRGVTDQSMQELLDAYDLLVEQCGGELP